MAIGNFIKEGSYTVFERLDYSKLNRFISANIIVFEDNQKKEVLLRTSVSVNGFEEAIEVKGIVNSEERAMESAPEFIDLIDDKECVLIDIDGDIKSDYIRQINRRVIRREGERIQVLSPTHIIMKDSGETFERVDNDKYVLMSKFNVKTDKQFDTVFDASNPVGSLYEYLMNQKAYEGCVVV